MNDLEYTELLEQTVILNDKFNKAKKVKKEIENLEFSLVKAEKLLDNCLGIKVQINRGEYIEFENVDLELLKSAIIKGIIEKLDKSKKEFAAL